MNTPTITAPPFSVNVPVADRKKKVLLVDASTYTRDLRSEVMRKLGMDVDCAADIAEARSWWRANLYDLVLFHLDNGCGQRDQFCDDIRAAQPPQRMAFLVGEPFYLADCPNELEASGAQSSDQRSNHRTMAADVRAAISAGLQDLTQRWGILEASRRISAVRAACNARTRAMQDRPAPPRDFEGRPPKTASPTLDDLLREEMQ